MDQGNTDSNNQNPNNVPGVPSSFGIDSNTTTATPGAVTTPPIAEQPVAPLSVTPDPVLDSSPPVGDSNWVNSGTPTSPPSPQPDINPFAGVNPPPVDQNQGLSPTQFNPFSAPTTEVPSVTPSTTETVPTDLSNLVNTSETTSYIPQTDTVVNTGATQPESLMVTPSVSGEAPQAVSATGGTGGFPKIFIAIGGLILLAVIAGSAYFILGIGKPSEQAPVSVPAEQVSPTPTPETVSPTPITSTSSASFSNLPGTDITPTIISTPSGSGSAYDLLRKRQTSTSSANP